MKRFGLFALCAVALLMVASASHAKCPFTDNLLLNPSFEEDNMGMPGYVPEWTLVNRMGVDFPGGGEQVDGGDQEAHPGREGRRVQGDVLRQRYEKREQSVQRLYGYGHRPGVAHHAAARIAQGGKPQPQE